MGHSVHLTAHHERPRWQWWFIFIATPLALILGTIGFWMYDRAYSDHASVLTSLYHTGQLFLLHMPHLEKPINIPLEMARWLAASAFGVATLSALYHIFAAEWRRFWFGFARDHVVICASPRSAR